ncbi:MAG: hypothetical protein J6A89_01225 [Clostridia bacterium]|nr:hypothetical protein [Clostridia bacterium]
MEKENKKKIEKLIYVGKTRNNQLENIVSEQGIIIVTRLLNEYNITDIFREDLRAINNVDYLVLDLSAFVNCSKNEEILRNLDRLRGNFDFRIIIIASGFGKGNELLAQCFNMGIYNLVTALNDMQMYDQLKICLSEKGMTYAQASQFRIDILYQKTSSNSVIKTEFKKVKQDISIGVLGITRHIGATTWAINLLHFLNELPNVKACLIEANNHKDIENLADLNEINKMGIEHFTSTGEVRVGGMEMFYDLSKIGDITAQKYDFYIYDFGTTSELTDSELASFLNKDIKFIILGSSPWEYKYISSTFEKIRISEQQDRLYFIYNFVKREEQKEVKAQMGSFNVYFNEYQPDAFELKSKAYLEEILKRYLTNSYFEEETKSKKINFNEILKRIGVKKYYENKK